MPVAESWMDMVFKLEEVFLASVSFSGFELAD